VRPGELWRTGTLEGNIFRNLAGRIDIARRVGVRRHHMVVCESAFPHVAGSSADYPRRSRLRAIATKSPDTIVITRRDTSWPILAGNVEYRQYAGALIAVHDSSLSISLLPPFNVLCPPIELPFDEMELKRTDWALWPEPYALRLRKLTGVDIVIGRDTVQWLRTHTNVSPFGLGM
jgi:hypothetical protein